jgi:putative SOS response-associated peptidase YedK
MCNLYTLDPVLTELAEDFDRFLGRRLHLAAGPATLSNQPWKTAVWPKYQGLFVRPVDPADPAGDLEPAVGRWGVVPWLHKGPAKDWKAQTNNCRSEEMATKASFRDALKEKRCIIPATGFYEHTGPKGSKTKHAITPASGGLHYLAGLWSRHTWDGETTESYTMLMQAAVDGDDMRPFHDRQPVFLDRESAAIWLDPKQDYAPLLKSPPRGHLAFDPAEPAAA